MSPESTPTGRAALERIATDNLPPVLGLCDHCLGPVFRGARNRAQVVNVDGPGWAHRGCLEGDPLGSDAA